MVYYWFQNHVINFIKNDILKQIFLQSSLKFNCSPLEKTKKFQFIHSINIILDMVFFIYTLYIFKGNVHSTNQLWWENFEGLGIYFFIPFYREIWGYNCVYQVISELLRKIEEIQSKLFFVQNYHENYKFIHWVYAWTK